MSILNEVEDERIRQDGKWGGPEHDDNHHTVDFCKFIKNYTGWAEMMAIMDSPKKARKRLIQIAALAVAAVESIDRLTPAVPCLGRVAYMQGFPISKNPFNEETEKHQFNGWIEDWKAEESDIPF